MTVRERFRRWTRFEEKRDLPFWADWLGPWKTWSKQGLEIPVGMSDEGFRDWCLERFGFEGMYSAFWGVPRVPVNIGPCPAFAEEVFEETGEYRVVRAGNGVIQKEFKLQDTSIHAALYLEYPIKNRADWVRYRNERLDPHAPGRYPESSEWERLKAEWRTGDQVISVDGGSFYGFLRDWIGMENLSLLVYDDFPLVREMMATLADFYIEVLRKAVGEVCIDFAMFWEDMCYKNGPLLSPAMFRKLLLPCYLKVTGFLAENGVELSWVDCDGNIDALLPLWLEGGVRGFYPLEVAAGMDANRLRAQYGERILMWGNVDKRALIAGPAAIDAELDRLAPAAAAGGFIPLVDHGVPDDIPLGHYLYYLDQRKKRWHPAQQE
jgi:uroporphyrinogen decarboxylase